MQRRFSSSAVDRRTNADNKRKFREKRSTFQEGNRLRQSCFTLFVSNLPQRIHWRWLWVIFQFQGFKDASNGGIMGTRVQLQVNSSQNQVGKEKSFKHDLLNNREVRDKKVANGVKESSQKLFHLEGENIESIEANLDDRPVISMDKSLIQRWSNCLAFPCTLGTWKVETFKSIANYWGDFISMESNSLKLTDFSKAAILISANQLKQIEEVIILERGDEQFLVKAPEVGDTTAFESGAGRAKFSYGHFDIDKEDSSMEDDSSGDGRSRDVEDSFNEEVGSEKPNGSSRSSRKYVGSSRKYAYFSKV
ncbi:hypothetical protein PVK06_041454 [Gossypium arboreum]|uniref:Uncharacterized protein n=1 Tax=Gossypium arboreum TaxID=29729 RepID=A0ABR0N939_GOSAR|nr:hypothetical protein PVK06_041454 [Gossypium arboreum]